MTLYYKMQEMLLQNAADISLQNSTFITKWVGTDIQVFLIMQFMLTVLLIGACGIAKHKKCTLYKYILVLT